MKRTMTAWALAAVALAGCKDDRAKGEATEISSAELRPIAAETAATQLAAAQCARETSCDRVGRARLYSTYGACTQHFLAARQRVFAGAGCADGVSERALTDCLASIRTEACDAVLDDVSRLALCDARRLCAR